MMNCDRLTNFRILEGCRYDRLTKLVIFPRSFIEISIFFFPKFLAKFAFLLPVRWKNLIFYFDRFLKFMIFLSDWIWRFFSTIVWRNQFFFYDRNTNWFYGIPRKKNNCFYFHKSKKIFAEKSHANLRGEKYLATYFITRNFQILRPIRSIPYAISLSATQRHCAPAFEEEH